MDELNILNIFFSFKLDKLIKLVNASAIDRAGALKSPFHR